MFDGLRNLKVRQQLLLVCLMLAVPAIVLTGWLFKDQLDELHHARHAQQGLIYLAQLQELSGLIAAHRGRMANVALLAEDVGAARADVRELQTRIDAIWSALAEQAGHDGDAFAVTAQLADCLKTWAATIANDGVITALASYADHGARLDQLSALQKRIVERAGLMRDPGSEGAYLAQLVLTDAQLERLKSGLALLGADSGDGAQQLEALVHQQARVEQNNAGIGKMDRNTQANMQLGERTLQAGHALESEAGDLLQLMQFFDLEPAQLTSQSSPACIASGSARQPAGSQELVAA